MFHNIKEHKLVELEENERSYVCSNCGSNKPNILPKLFGMGKGKEENKIQ